MNEGEPKGNQPVSEPIQTDSGELPASSEITIVIDPRDPNIRWDNNFMVVEEPGKYP